MSAARLRSTGINLVPSSSSTAVGGTAFTDDPLDSFPSECGTDGAKSSLLQSIVEPAIGEQPSTLATSPSHRRRHRRHRPTIAQRLAVIEGWVDLLFASVAVRLRRTAQSVALSARYVVAHTTQALGRVADARKLYIQAVARLRLLGERVAESAGAAWRRCTDAVRSGVSSIRHIARHVVGTLIRAAQSVTLSVGAVVAHTTHAMRRVAKARKLYIQPVARLRRLEERVAESAGSAWHRCTDAVRSGVSSIRHIARHVVGTFIRATQSVTLSAGAVVAHTTQAFGRIADARERYVQPVIWLRRLGKRVAESAEAAWHRCTDAVCSGVSRIRHMALDVVDTSIRAARSVTLSARDVVAHTTEAIHGIAYARRRDVPACLRPLEEHGVRASAKEAWQRCTIRLRSSVSSIRLIARHVVDTSIRVAPTVALIAIAVSYDSRTEISTRRAASPTIPELASNADVGPAAPTLLPAEVIAPLARLRPATQPVTAVVEPSPAAVLRRVRSTRNNTQAIRAVLARYRDAVSILDVTALRAVWPSADARGVQQQFEGVVEQNLEFESCRISVAGQDAKASCAGVLESGFAAGRHRPHKERKQWHFTLRTVRERWIITAVSAERS